MPRFTADHAQHSYIDPVEQVARIVSTTRNPAAVLQRTLQILGETLGARGGAVVLNGEAPPRLAGVSWGEHQDQMAQLGGELLDGIDADSAPTARQTILPGSARPEVTEGVVLAAPIRGLQQALGVIVFFASATAAPTLDADLSLVNAAGVYLGFYLQSTDLRERLKTLPEAGEMPGQGGIMGYDRDRIIGDSPAIRAVMQQVQQAARSRSTVLLRGESGTGKELGARALHKLSERHQQPFVKLNCAALPESLLESELFGHERGAFTGAVRMRRGRFEMADKGTFFLDEIGSLSVRPEDA